MTHSLQKRLNFFERVNQKVDSGRFKCDPRKKNFGYKHLEVLHDPGTGAIKSYPCVMYNKATNIEYAVKIIPVTKYYLGKTKWHPADIEVILLKQFNKLIKFRISPHLTYHIASFAVPNNVRALRKFPLKSLRQHIEPMSRVLVAEYAPGGSIMDWLASQPGTLEQWRYIVFSVCWTLLVLQDRYRCIHNDLHYGNVLIDTIAENEKPLAYHLVCEDGLDIEFKISVPGILPKLWDWEVATAFGKGFKFQNPMGLGLTHFPSEFDPHYDLHYFLTNLLELDQLPTEIVDLIYSIYGDEFVPSEEAKEGLERKMNGDTQSSFRSDEWEVDTSSSSDEDEEENPYYDSEDELHAPSKIPPRRSWRRMREVDPEGEEKTEYLIGERLMNGAWRKRKDLPTPLSLLQHDFFSCYRNDVRLVNRAPAVTFRHIREEATAWRLEGEWYV